MCVHMRTHTRHSTTLTDTQPSTRDAYTCKCFYVQIYAHRVASGGHLHCTLRLESDATHRCHPICLPVFSWQVYIICRARETRSRKRTLLVYIICTNATDIPECLVPVPGDDVPSSTQTCARTHGNGGDAHHSRTRVLTVSTDAVAQTKGQKVKTIVVVLR